MRQPTTVGIFLVAAMLMSSCTAVAGSTAVTGSVEADSPTVGRAAGASSPVAANPVGANNNTFATVPANASYIVRSNNNTLNVYATPHDLATRPPDEQHQQSLPAIDANGTPLTLSALGEPNGDWLEVRLAQRPNFSTGWVKVDDIHITWTTLRIEIDSNNHTLTLFDGDERIVWGTVAIGTATTPTPIGETYVSELLTSGDPDSLYGPFALGLALFSDQITEYAGGNGQIGIHGTNRPELLGTRASLGCVRTHNDLISDLAGRVPLGTPVVVL